MSQLETNINIIIRRHYHDGLDLEKASINFKLYMFMKKSHLSSWTDARRPVPRLWIRSAEVRGNVVRRMGTQHNNNHLSSIVSFKVSFFSSQFAFSQLIINLILKVIIDSNMTFTFFPLSV